MSRRQQKYESFIVDGQHYKVPIEYWPRDSWGNSLVFDELRPDQISELKRIAILHKPKTSQPQIPPYRQQPPVPSGQNIQRFPQPTSSHGPQYSQPSINWGQRPQGQPVSWNTNVQRQVQPHVQPQPVQTRRPVQQQRQVQHQPGVQPQVTPQQTPSQQAPNILCVSRRVYALGKLDYHIYRKKLIRIRRDFDPENAYSPTLDLSKESFNAYLSGGTSISYLDFDRIYQNYLQNCTQPKPDTYEDYKERIRNDRIPWNSFTETFHSNERMAEIKRLSGDQKFDPSFQVFVSSLLYLPHSKVKNNDNVEHMWRNFFLNDHYKQLGTHLFVSYWGDLHMYSTFWDPNHWDPHNLPRSIQMCYDIKGKGKLSSIYPVHRNLIKNGFQMDLCLGLYYDDPSVNKGDRLYHRSDETNLKFKNVREVNHKKLIDYTKGIGSGPFAAFYVCAGAKLVVVDHYEKQTKGAAQTMDIVRDHNRTLIQQGGVVIATGELMVSMSILTLEKDPTKDEKFDGLRYHLMTWQEFCQNSFDTLDATKKNQLGAIKQPVLFLGAQDSQYNSIAWNLSIEEPLSLKGSRRLVLQVPYSARITAIGQGTHGLAEISLRVSYSLLHDSVVSPNTIPFNLPGSSEHNLGFNKDITRYILDPGNSRSYNVNPFTIDGAVIPLEGRPLPLEFNFTKIYPAAKVDRFFEFQNNFKIPLAVPPMYPDVRDAHGLSPGVDNGLPSLEYPEQNVDACYLHTGYHVQLKYQKRERKVYTYSETQIAQRPWVRVPNVDPECITVQVGLRVADSPGLISYRLGVDGWIYESCPVKVTHYEQNYMIYHDHGEPPKRTLPKRMS